MSGGRSRQLGSVFGVMAVVAGLAGCATAGADAPVSTLASSVTAALPVHTAASTTALTTTTSTTASTTKVMTTSTTTSTSTSTSTTVPTGVAAVPPASPNSGEPVAAATTTTSASPPVRSGANVNRFAEVGDPLRIVVPSVGIDGPIVPAGVLGDGTIAVPDDPKVAGWFTGGPRPGEVGPAVIVGHVDSRRLGLGVFWRLDRVAVGAAVTVQTSTAALHFVVVEVQQIPKVDFPTADVYGLVPTAALRLITCGGSFDRSVGHYRDNVVIYLEATDG